MRYLDCKNADDMKKFTKKSEMLSFWSSSHFLTCRLEAAKQLLQFCILRRQQKFHDPRKQKKILKCLSSLRFKDHKLLSYDIDCYTRFCSILCHPNIGIWYMMCCVWQQILKICLIFWNCRMARSTGKSNLYFVNFSKLLNASRNPVLQT